MRSLPMLKGNLIIVGYAFMHTEIQNANLMCALRHGKFKNLDDFFIEVFKFVLYNCMTYKWDVSLIA